MLLLRLLSVFLLALVTAWGCAGAPNQEPPPELLTAIDSFYASVESGNGEARIALFSDSAIMMPNHWTLTRGKDGIARIIRSSEGSVFRLKDREVVDMDVDGSIAYVTNSYFYTWHAEGDEPQWHKTKNVHIWKRDAAGDWKLHLDIWNSDVPMSQFADE